MADKTYSFSGSWRNERRDNNRPRPFSPSRKQTMLGVNKLSWYWNMWEGNGFAEIPLARLDEARTIPGVTLARNKRGYACMTLPPYRWSIAG
jgi:hypothetical protein